VAKPDDEGLKREFGVTRRDLLRRGAIVGGTLLWATPVIQSIAPPAYAQGASPHRCCECKPDAPTNVDCSVNGFQCSFCPVLCGGSAFVEKCVSGNFDCVGAPGEKKCVAA
jgi:hypothetical protein